MAAILQKWNGIKTHFLGTYLATLDRYRLGRTEYVVKIHFRILGSKNKYAVGHVDH